MRGNYWRHTVTVPPCRIDKHRAIRLVKGGVVVRDMQVSAGAVAPLGDDDVDGAFDVGVILMDWRCDVAVADRAAEVLCETPLLRHTGLDLAAVQLGDFRGQLLHKLIGGDACLVHGFDKGASGLAAVDRGPCAVGPSHMWLGRHAAKDG